VKESAAMLYPYLGIVWLFLAGVLLYRGFSKTRQTAIQTFFDSEPVLQSKRVRRWNLGLGFCFLALSLAYFILGIH
jgi:hypothetical protein